MTLSLVRATAPTCAGQLRLDAAQKTVRWAETAADPRCGATFETSFDDLRAVRVRPDAGVLLRFRPPGPGTMVLLPAPHLGAIAGPRVERGDAAVTELPAAVLADCARAADRILLRLGRPTPPPVVLRQALYGIPAEASIGAVLETPGAYAGRAVRLPGRLRSAGEGAYELVEGSQTLTAVPEAELAAFLPPQVAALQDRVVDLVGVVHRGETARAGGAGPMLAFWALEADTDPPAGAERRTSIAALLAAPPMALGDPVRVVGKFRGRNLFGDLPRQSKPPGDWVIKDDRSAVWVVGAPRTDSGFALDPGSPADTSSWLEVVARPAVQGGRVVLHASSLAVIPPPPGARALPPRQGISRETAPAVVFVLPLESEPVAPDARFVIQFSKPMEEESFRGRVGIRYAGDGGENGFRVESRYDHEHRSLVVDPGVPLRVGAQVEIALLPGIIDADGMPLEPRPGPPQAGAVDVLRYTVGELR